MQWIARASALLLGLPTNGTKFSATIAHVTIFGKQYSSVYFQRILAAL